jgi:hypothetical protein
MSRSWRRGLVAVAVLGLMAYLASILASDLSGEGVAVWAVALVVGGVVLVSAAAIVFDAWLVDAILRWVRGRAR